jgi:hypothetical protein
MNDVDFFIIGVQRCGTTSLKMYLSADPAITMPLRETDYFSFHYSRGWEWYEECLGEGEVRGEKCVSYIACLETPSRMANDFPNAKFIILLRDPVRRAWSHYNWALGMRQERRPFSQAIHYGPVRNEDWFSYLKRGHYARQIRNWYAFFPEDQFLVLRSEDMFVDPENILKKVYAFLEMEPYLLEDYRIHGAVKHPEMPENKTTEWLRKYYKPHNEKLEGLLGRSMDW